MRHFEEPPEDDPNPRYPCGICSKTVGQRMRAVQCDLCNYWNHIKCDEIDVNTYNLLKKSNESDLYYCKICKEEIFVFQTLNNDEFHASFVKNNVNFNENLNLKLSMSSAHKILFNDLDSLNKEDNNAINCSYYDYSSTIPNSNKKNNSMFHLNIASLGLHKEELVTSLSLLNFEFDIIAITETKITADTAPIFDLSLSGYKPPYQKSTESEKGGALLYVKNNINCKRREDLEKIMYKSCELESVFIEVINEGKKNQIYSCIYRHPKMDLEDFTQNYFDKLINKLSTENKTSYLMGDFNIDLLKIEDDEKINNFYNIVTSNLFVLHITLPTRITSHSKTLIDNIFSNDPDFSQAISGNFTFSISDHLPQFLLVPKENHRPPSKHNMYKRSKKYEKVDVVADFINVNWNEIIAPEKMDPNYSLEMFNEKIEELVNKHLPLKKMNKKDFKLQAKPWITPGIINSIKRRDMLLNSFVKAKDANRKEELHTKYKCLRNKIVALIRTSKKNHYQKYFTNNAKDIKKTWNGIKGLINIRSLTKEQPNSIFINNKLENEPINIAEGFNSYFASVAEKLQQNIFSGNTN